MKKLILATTISMIALSSGSAMAEEESWIPQNNRYSQPSDQQRPTRNINNYEEVKEEVKYSKTGNATSLSSSSGNNNGALSLGDLSGSQAKSANLDAQIKEAKQRLELAEIQSKIMEITGQSVEEDEEVEVEMIGSHGKDGKIFATIQYNDTQFDIEKGDILNEDWVVIDVTFNTVVMFNVETKDQKTLQFNGPTLDKKYQKK